MLILKILKKDLLRNKIVTLVVFAFVLLSALLVASGTNLIVELSSSLNSLFAKAEVPHFVQMHVGDFDQDAIDQWATTNEHVQAQQTVEMITVDGTNLYLGGDETPEANSIMDISFVQQNDAFDFLLDQQNNIVQLSPGEIGVPVYYAQARNLKLGDAVWLRNGAWEQAFIVTAFVRDAQMNPSIIHSKRFLISDADFATIREQFPDTEYLIEFLITDRSLLGEFGSAYAASGLPNRGPAVDYNLFLALNALTDGMIAGVVIVLSLLLMVIALLCLRFTLLATLEEDVKEIGVMKAIGIARQDIHHIYLIKYMALAGLAVSLGYLASQPLNRVLAANMMRYAGSAPKTAMQHILPIIAVTIIFLMVLVSCVVILRRFSRLSAVEALRSGHVGGVMNVRRFRLSRSRVPDVNLFLGIRDVYQRFGLFWLLGFIFFFAVTIIIVPVHFLTTIESPTFISYMGIGRSDLRVDLRQSEQMAARFEDMVATLAADADVARYAPPVTSPFTLLLDDGSHESINVETGDFTQFPLDYVRGEAPQSEHEIALSVLNAQEMDKAPGDTLVLLINGQERDMTVTGIYQDVTNGGRTAKAPLPHDTENALWYSVSLDLNPSVALDEKTQAYTDLFYPARVTDLDGYVAQTLGNTIAQLQQVTVVAVGVGLVVSVLITSLFLNMLITKDAAQIAVMRGIGFSLRHIRHQYISRTLFLLGMGIAFGTLFSNTLGQRLVSVLWSVMGASQIRFVIDPLQAYVFLPLLLLGCVSLTTLISIRGIKDSSITQMIME
jgi:putative ABC transport system permease protein